MVYSTRLDYDVYNRFWNRCIKETRGKPESYRGDGIEKDPYTLLNQWFYRTFKGNLFSHHLVEFSDEKDYVMFLLKQ